jgi:hypothetical protein
MSESHSPLDSQVGGNHYKTMKIQPMEYIVANDIGFAEGTAITYLSRWKSKNGIEDLKKARHTIELLIELEEGKVEDVVMQGNFAWSKPEVPSADPDFTLDQWSSYMRSLGYPVFPG